MVNFNVHEGVDVYAFVAWACKHLLSRTLLEFFMMHTKRNEPILLFISSTTAPKPTALLFASLQTHHTIYSKRFWFTDSFFRWKKELYIFQRQPSAYKFLFSLLLSCACISFFFGRSHECSECTAAKGEQDTQGEQISEKHKHRRVFELSKIVYPQNFFPLQNY